MDIKFSMSEADVTRPETPTANRIGSRDMSGRLYRDAGATDANPRGSSHSSSHLVNPIKTHYENVNDKTLQLYTGDPSAFLHRYREKIRACRCSAIEETKKPI